MSRIILEAVLDCIFGAMSGCRACVCFEVCLGKGRGVVWDTVEILKFVGVS